jgi:hypothetical protein
MSPLSDYQEFGVTGLNPFSRQVLKVFAGLPLPKYLEVNRSFELIIYLEVVKRYGFFVKITPPSIQGYCDNSAI